jgi:hypothetical protein
MPLERRIFGKTPYSIALFSYVFMSLKEVPSYFIGSFVLFLVVYVSQFANLCHMSAIHNKVAKQTHCHFFKSIIECQ